MDKHTPGRICDVLAALDARNAAHALVRMNAFDAAKAARELVSIHLRRAAIAKSSPGLMDALQQIALREVSK